MSETITQILREHAQHYPLMQPQDAVKLLYQSEFGGGHLISDEAAAQKRLEEELSSCTRGDVSPYEDIGGGMVRLNLHACALPRTAVIARLFAASAKLNHGSMQAFMQKLEHLKTLTREGVFRFSPAQLEAYLERYIQAGCPAVSHSEAYREAYKPAYRVLDMRYIPYLPLFERLEDMDAFVLGIDGRAGAGKSTLAKLVSAAYPCSVVHMDDFFLPFDMRTEARLSEPGGNLHYERFKVEVIPNLRSGQPFTHGVFDHTPGVIKTREVRPSPRMVVEGSYSHHPYFGEPYDLKVFLEISPETQQARIRRRNPELFRRFIEEWIPMENRYFDAFHIKENSDMVFEAQE